MKLIESKAELLQQQKGIDGIYKQIELCGRTCYKSTDKITDDSARPFVTRMIASKHTAMLEHGTVYLKYSCVKSDLNPLIKYREHLSANKYSKCYIDYDELHMTYYVTTNFRVLVENGWTDDLKYACEPTKYHEKRYTIKFTCDRGVSHELVRHRVFSFAQESTRYCNYSKDKFGNEISFIIPSWAHTLQEGVLEYSVLEITPKEASFMQSCYDSEKRYLEMMQQSGATPQEARQVLINAIKTEVCMTGFASDWRFFFNLRYYGETGKPHPDMELVASKARDEFIKAGLWDDIMSHPTTFNDGKSN